MAEADGGGTPGPAAPKISFVKRYRPLDWIIGTGRYVDDIEVAIAEKTAAARGRSAPSSAVSCSLRSWSCSWRSPA